MAGLRTCIVTYLNLVGAPLLNRDAGPAAQVVRHVRRWLYRGGRDQVQLEQRWSMVGQQVIRVVPLDSKLNRQVPMGLLFYEILDLIHAQANLLQDDLHLSGVMSCGMVLDEPDAFVGAGVNTARRLLEACPPLPRVVIDPNLLSLLDTEPLLRKDSHDAATEKRYIKALLRRDSDGLWFIDYLWAMQEEADHPAEYGQFLKHHHQYLLDRLHAKKQIDARSVQLAWLRRYHNRTIRKLFAEREDVGGLSKEDLLLPSIGLGAYRFS